MKQREKLKIAKKLLTKKEKQKKVSPFDSDGWLKRKKAIADRVSRKQGAAHERALKRKLLNPLD